MLTSSFLFLLTAVVIFMIGAHGVIQSRHALRKLLALNVCTTGVFLVLVASGEGSPPDPVPHAMVLTGIVVALSTTAVAIGLIVRLDRRRRSAPEDA